MKKTNIGKRRNVYNSIVEPAYLDYPTNISDLAQESPYGGIDLASDEFYQIHAHSSRHPPSPRPGGPPKPPFRPQSQQSGPKVLQKDLSTTLDLQIVESRCNESIEGL